MYWNANFLVSTDSRLKERIFFKFRISNQHFWQHCPSPFLVKVLHRLKHGLLVHEQHQKVFLAVQQPPQQIVQAVQDQLDRVSWHHCCCTKCRTEPWVPFTSFRKTKPPTKSWARDHCAIFKLSSACVAGTKSRRNRTLMTATIAKLTPAWQHCRKSRGRTLTSGRAVTILWHIFGGAPPIDQRVATGDLKSVFYFSCICEGHLCVGHSASSRSCGASSVVFGWCCCVVAEDDDKIAIA